MTIVFSGEAGSRMAAENAVIDHPLNLENEDLDVINCRNAYFLKKVSFVNCRFNGLADFEGAKFEKGVEFCDCVFEEFLMLRGADLGDRTLFKSCTFKGGLSVAAGNSEAGDTLTSNDDLLHLRCQNCTFFGYITFNNRAFLRSANFSKSVFHDPPHFQNVKFHPGTTFDGSVFKKVNTGDDIRKRRAEEGFRCLKRIMSTDGDIELTGLFTALEFQARRSRKNVNFFEKIMITIYQAVSDFGRSTVRPLLFMLGISVLNCLLLALFLPLSNTEAYHAVFWFIVQQSLHWFSVFGSTYKFASLSALPYESTWLLGVCGLIQSLSVIASMSLLALAIRRRFS